MPQAIKYNAFISYYQQPDKPLAVALEKALSVLGSKWYVLKFRALSIFRDETGVSGSNSLDKLIENGIDSSEFLILLASQQGKESKRQKNEIDWVAQESKLWLDTKPRELDIDGHLKNPKIIICVTDGQIKWDEKTSDFDWSVTTCLPDCLQGQFSKVPYWIDFRDVSHTSTEKIDKLSLDFPDFKKKVAGISSQIQDITVDSLIAKDRHYKQIGQLLLSAIIISLTGLTIFAFMQKGEAEDQKNLALTNLRNYEFERLKESISNAQVFIDARGYGLKLANEELSRAALLIRKHSTDSIFLGKQKDIALLRQSMKR